jgi:MFS family permease
VTSRGLGSDFRRLWGAYSVSELGSAVGAGALPLVAVLVLDVSTFQVSLLAGLSAIAAALIVLPLGSVIEFRVKRPTMVAADLVRFLALGSVPVAAALGILSYAQLCVVGVLQAASLMSFQASSTAHLKNLVPAERRVDATSRFETTFWTAQTAGPPLGGVLISWLGATATLAVDAVSFLLSALGVRSLRSSEPAPPQRAVEHHWRRELTAGWRYIFGHRALAALFWNSMVFGGCILLSSPLLAVLMLRDLGFTPWQYGLALGLPSLGGVLGAMCTRRLTGRYGADRVLLAFGVLRTLWLGLIPFAPDGAWGLVVIVAAETLLLFCAGVFNPLFVAFRMDVTADTHLARVTTAWSISTRSAQPLFILAGGAIAAATSARTVIGLAAVLLLTSGLLLPWRAPHDPSAERRLGQPPVDGLAALPDEELVDPAERPRAEEPAGRGQR